MESGMKSSGGVEIPKRKRSLDRKSFCESKIPKFGANKRKVRSENDRDDAKTKKSKIRTEVPMSSYESGANGRSKGLHGISLAVRNNGTSFNFPKRQRGSVCRKNPVSDQCSESSRLSNSVDRVGASKTKVIKSDDLSNSRLSRKSVRSDAKSKQKVDSKPAVDSSCSNVKLMQKVGDKKDSRLNLVVNSGDTSAKKWRTHSRKRNDLETSIRKSEPSSVSNSLFTDGKDDENDEENLEQNAAMMLSSRFDPSCTGFSSKINSSESQTADELSFPVLSARESVSRLARSSVGEDYSRSLRHRREDKGKGVLKIRRHFYDVRGGDVDPYWVLKRRIKIFWPLDDSWYDGIVNVYHKKTKLHHIKYDDRDEEWVNLGEEKFKLLLLRSEVPGKAKSRKLVKNSSIGQTAQPADDNSSTGNSLESEPIALWLASKFKRVKDLPKASKRRKTEKTDISEDNVDYSRITRNKPGCNMDKTSGVITCQSDKHMVYVRKKYPKKSAKKNSYGVCVPTTKGDKFYHGCVDSYKQLWSFDVKGKLTLNIGSLESKEFRVQICLPLLPYLEFLCGLLSFRMLHNIFMRQHGVIMTTSPAVFLEMLFVDNNLGLRFLLYEGCLKQALAIVFQILTVFGQPDEYWNGDKNLPVTSIRFQLSSVHDLQKQHVFEVYRFSKLQSSKWLYLQSKIPQQRLLSKQLSYSECTYGNIKKLEFGFFQKCKTHVVLERSSSEYFKKKFELGKVSQLPMFFLNSHLQSHMENSFARANLQYRDAMCSQKTSEKDGQPVAECARFKPSSVPAQDITKQREISQLGSENPSFRGFSSYRRMDGSVPNSNPIEYKNSSKRGRSSPISSPVGINFMPDGFSNGPRKPRTQVQYTLPFTGHDSSTEMPSPGSLPCKRIRRATLRRLSDGSVNNHKNSELITCSANVLVTNEEKGWRECGAHIVKEVADDNEWRLAVKLSGVTRFLYKVKHILQLGSTNRYSHAMIWKGGKDWVLEFPDRSQWMLFKEMYEECYDRKIRAASVKNIPIPGVRVVDENDGYGDEVPFVQNCNMYFRQVQTDAEMAIDRSRILYDMDSEDEEWLTARKNCAEKQKIEQISDEFLEMAMDMFEKVSYAQRRESFADAEVEELAVGLGSVEAVKLVYLHWRQKREKTHMPLIRHFQPPPWERYHQQLKEWEQNVARGNCAVSVGDLEKDKPPMFAFCLKPRGLDAPNRGSKQRSHRRLSVSGNHHAFSTDRDSPLAFGRRPNGHAFVDEYSDASPPLHPSARVWSPRDSRFSLSTKWKVNRKVYKNKHKKNLTSYAYFHNQRTNRNRNKAQLWNFKELDVSNLDEFHLCNALGAAQRTRKLAKLKKEKAQMLLCRADLAIHRAVTTLMSAEAMKGVN